jgi:hypothetical protein
MRALPAGAVSKKQENQWVAFIVVSGWKNYSERVDRPKRFCIMRSLCCHRAATKRPEGLF